jgi:transcription termination factor Rho
MARGVMEVMQDGYGFLRSPVYTFMPSNEDVMVPPPLLRRLGLRGGDEVECELRSPKPKERFFGMGRIEMLNGEPPAAMQRAVTPFDMLTPVFPQKRLVLERMDTPSLAMRVIDLVAPLGKGQRGLIVAPPRCGTTTLLKDIAASITANSPETALYILLIDALPEDVTDLQRSTKAQVIRSTCDEVPERHFQVAEFVLEMARRKVELGKDVVILLDSLTRLARAGGGPQAASARAPSVASEATALQKAKRFFASARSIENGGSLTLLATLQVDGGTPGDTEIYETFKALCNLEIVLDRALVDKRIFPAIQLAKSGTRREELILHPEELQRVVALRKVLNGQTPQEAMEVLMGRLKKTRTNPEFLLTLQST